MRHRNLPTIAELRTLLRPFCQKYRIHRLEVFGSAARGLSTLLVQRYLVPVISATRSKNPFLRALLMPQFTGTLW